VCKVCVCGLVCVWSCVCACAWHTSEREKTGDVRVGEERAHVVVDAHIHICIHIYICICIYTYIFIMWQEHVGVRLCMRVLI